MENYQKHIWVLITRDLSGESTLKEKRELRQWLAEDDEHQKFYEHLHAFWNQSLSYSKEDAFLFDYDSGLQRLRKKIATDKKASGSSTKDFRKVNWLSPQWTWSIAAAVVLLVVSAAIYIVSQTWEKPKTTYATTAREQLIITLPDSSVVRLNKNSKITYRTGLPGPKRVITLKGEAFFDVSRNEQRPFVIRTQNGIVRVLGTSFLVKQQGKAGLLIAVQEGVVSLRGPEKPIEKAVQVKAGQAAIIHTKTQQIRLEQANIENYLSWITGQLVFSNMPLGKVFSQLENIYGIKMMVESTAINSLKLTAYTQKTSLKEVLHMISKVMGLQYQKEDETIVWSHQNNFNRHSMP